jgi:hypothetical protein
MRYRYTNRNEYQIYWDLQSKLEYSKHSPSPLSNLIESAELSPDTPVTGDFALKSPKENAPTGYRDRCRVRRGEHHR